MTDTILGDEYSRRVAEKLGDALAAPTIRPGCSGHHMEFPGTITIPPETLMELIRGYCRSFDDHGFEHIVLIAAHGGNYAPVNTVAPEIAREIDANVIAIADLSETMALMNEGLRKAGVEYEEPVVHAGATETAIVLAANEGLVQPNEIDIGHEGEITTSRLLSEGFKTITENGVLGDPREATHEAGEAVLDTVTTAYAEQIETERNAV
jgi:creatinine amidohydrolase